MRTIASGVALANKLSLRPVVIWHRDKWLDAPFSALFLTDKLPFRLVEVGKLRDALQYEMPRKKNLYISAGAPLFDGKKRIYQKEDSAEFNTLLEETVAEGDAEFVIHSGFIFHKFDAALFNSIFRIAPAVTRRIDEILQGQTPDVALQIRRTDNARSIQGSPLHAFEEIAVKIIEENPEAKIFLATDDQSVKASMARLLGTHLIYNPCPASRNTVAGMVDAAAELYILSRCRHIYGSYWSSFSEIASLMGQVPLTVVR